MEPNHSGVVGLKVEADGDIHMELRDATGDRVGTVSAEIPVGPKWCEIRQIVFGWMTQNFPFSLKTAKGLKIGKQHVITKNLFTPITPARQAINAPSY